MMLMCWYTLWPPGRRAAWQDGRDRSRAREKRTGGQGGEEKNGAERVAWVANTRLLCLVCGEGAPQKAGDKRQAGLLVKLGDNWAYTTPGKQGGQKAKEGKNRSTAGWRAAGMGWATGMRCKTSATKYPSFIIRCCCVAGWHALLLSAGGAAYARQPRICAGAAGAAGLHTGAARGRLTGPPARPRPPQPAGRRRRR